VKTGIGSVAYLAAAVFFVGNAAAAAKKGQGEVWPVKPGQAQVVLVRNSKVSSDQPTFLYETTSGQPKYLGLIANKRKFVLDLPPGDHVLMIGKMPLCDFMQLSVLPDKRYYGVVVSRWPDGTTLRPVRHQGDGYVYGTEEFLKLLNYTTIAGKAPESIVKEETRQAEAVYPAKWDQWNAKTPEQKAMLTIRKEDSE
jgi:hypothetical protein